MIAFSVVDLPAPLRPMQAEDLARRDRRASAPCSTCDRAVAGVDAVDAAASAAPDRRPAPRGRRGSPPACRWRGRVPKFSTVIRSARSITTSMLCSISSTVAAGAMLADQRLEGVDLACGQALRRLVEDQQRRAQRQAHGDLEQPLVAVGEGRRRVCRRAVRQADAGQRGAAVSRAQIAGVPRRCTASATLSKTVRRGKIAVIWKV